MAGGPSTPELTAAVSNAGGLGFLAGALLSPEALDAQLSAVEALTRHPYGVNLFLPSARRGRAEELRDYRRRVAPLAAGLGVEPGEPTWNDDSVAAKIDVVCAHHPAAVSLTFGSPGGELTERIHAEIGALVVGTVTSAAEAETAASDGADLLVVQGIEAGGHRAVFVDEATDPNGGAATSIGPLLVEVRRAVDVPLIAAGGIMDGSGIAAALAFGAAAAQLGTAFLCSDEAGTSAVHRRALLDQTYERTVITRAFSGRPARGLLNEFAAGFTEGAPAAYPEVGAITGPLRAAATAAGRSDVPNLWAGTGWRAVTEASASDIVARLTRELAAA
jgi:nitronate monooxygenase